MHGGDRRDNNLDTLKIKVIAGFVRLLIILGVLLFLPAWSFNFWEAWSYLLIFLLSAILITTYFLRKDPKLLGRRLSVGLNAEKEKSQNVIHTLAILFSVLLVVVPGFDHRLQWSEVPSYLVIIGDIFVLIAFVIGFLVFKENSFASRTIEVVTNHTVISTGPYRIVRHPMYSGALLMFLFTPIALGSFWALLLALPLMVVIIVRLLHEEKFLVSNLLGYKEYCQHIRYRLVPQIW
jgi:protein-S-isoprenylcysteine O-methyltransferase Ste14